MRNVLETVSVALLTFTPQTELVSSKVLAEIQDLKLAKMTSSERLNAVRPQWMQKGSFDVILSASGHLMKRQMLQELVRLHRTVIDIFI